MMKFDLAVIGSGPGGFAATMRAVDFGKNVCLIEAGHIGGTGIMNGPLTSKTMWELSVDYSIAAAVDRGYRASGLQVDYNMVKKTVIAAAKTKQYQMLSQIESFQLKIQMLVRSPIRRVSQNFSIARHFKSMVKME